MEKNLFDKTRELIKQCLMEERDQTRKYIDMSHRSSMRMSRMIDLGARRKATEKLLGGGGTVEEDKELKKNESILKAEEKKSELP